MLLKSHPIRRSPRTSLNPRIHKHSTVVLKLPLNRHPLRDVATTPHCKIRRVTSTITHKNDKSPAQPGFCLTTCSTNQTRSRSQAFHLEHPLAQLPSLLACPRSSPLW